MRRTLHLASLTAIVSLGAVIACSSPKDVSGFGSGEDPTDPGGKDPNSGKLGGSSGSSGSSGTATGCTPGAGQYDIPGDGCDNDGDGKVDNPTTCDSASTGATASDFAKSMGICDEAGSRGFGVVSATFTRGYQRTDEPKAQQHNALAKFGSVLVPREGAKLGVLSTGYAQEYDGAQGVPFGGGAQGVDWWGARQGRSTGAAPPGFPKAASGCMNSSDVNDVIDLHLELKAPANATGFKFDFNFHSGEWPAYICTPFNDSFIAYLNAKGFHGGVADNMSFDPSGNPVSVNNGFFDRCTPNAPIGCEGPSPGTSTCAGGAGELAGTGFGLTGNFCGTNTVAGGATGWLTSQAAVTPGETFTLDLMIWDTGDGDLDSSVLLDNFQWLGEANVTTQTGRPPK
ncbi:MAG: hypothetical protein JWP97_1398 [Labilithrix sp.]|nr:hypothetical protein [Labilithrix sp.]